jgi:hypothetical protein
VLCAEQFATIFQHSDNAQKVLFVVKDVSLKLGGTPRCEAQSEKLRSLLVAMENQVMIAVDSVAAEWDVAKAIMV